ncbi:unnamed protein product [Blepharisma stoltei]|uniref:Response regulatory domain-containing protein n=1 Tax=Blepharisma stoltei TaxID=1481888 RepID=A0AAU9JX17_9CILI|nr:unnamed protein product [Blepharisma stoltei]
MGTNYKYSIDYIYKQSPFLYYENHETESKFQSEIYKYSWTSLNFFFAFAGSFIALLYWAIKSFSICFIVFSTLSGCLWLGLNYKMTIARLGGLIIGLAIEIQLRENGVLMLGYFVDWVIHYYTYKTWISYVEFYLLFILVQIIHGIALNIPQSIVTGMILTLVMSLLEKDRRDLWLLVDIYRARSIFQSFIIDSSSNSILIIGEDGRIIMTNDAAIAYADKRGLSRVLGAHATEFFTLTAKETIDKILKNALEGMTIEEELTLDSTPILVKAKPVHFNHKPVIHLTISDISNQIARRNFLASINKAQEFKVSETEKKLTECYVHQTAISENEFTRLAKCISCQKMTRTVLQCLIGDVSLKNDKFDAEVEMANIIQWSWCDAKLKKLNITLSKHPDLNSPIFCDRQLHNNLLKGVIHFIILKSDKKSDISVFLGKITHDNETYLNYSFTFDSQTLDINEFNYLFSNDPNKIKKIEEMHDILKKYDTVELAMFDIMLTILGGQIISHGPQQPPVFHLVYSLKLQEHAGQAAIDAPQIKLYENSADIDSTTISWRWSQEKTEIIQINRNRERYFSEQETKESASHLQDNKLKPKHPENAEESENGEDDVDENVTIFGLSHYLQKEIEVPGRNSHLPVNTSSFIHNSNASILSDFHVIYKGFILIGNKFLVNSLQKNMEAILGKEVEICANQEDLVNKVTKAAGENSLCIIIIDVPNGFEAAKTIRQNGYKHARRPHIVAMYSNNEEGNLTSYKEAGIDETIPKSAGREVLQSIINKIL